MRLTKRMLQRVTTMLYGIRSEQFAGGFGERSPVLHSERLFIFCFICFNLDVTLAFVEAMYETFELDLMNLAFCRSYTVLVRI